MNQSPPHPWSKRELCAPDSSWVHSACGSHADVRLCRVGFYCCGPRVCVSMCLISVWIPISSDHEVYCSHQRRWRRPFSLYLGLLVFSLRSILGSVCPSSGPFQILALIFSLADGLAIGMELPVCPDWITSTTAGWTGTAFCTDFHF